MKKTIRLGTRGSPLALIQAEDVRKSLYAAHPGLENDCVIEIVPIRTSGDWKPEHKEKTFLEMGGNKGLFTKEIEEALQADFIDMAVHSMKDVESWLPAGLSIAAILPRQDPHDAFISSKAKSLHDLPSGAIVGTASLRRQAQILAQRPDLSIITLRGNVETRLKKIADGVADATLLAVAGLSRLGMTDKIASIISADDMLPAAAQGAIGIETRSSDKEILDLLKSITCAKTAICVHAERAMLQHLDGSCQTPIGALARLDDQDQIHIDGLVARPDGTRIIRHNLKGAASDAIAIGTELGRIIKNQMPPNFFGV